ncbi:MAG: TrmJ/YjtD family RNA methyltransferase [Deltaproteobacteria bacterium]|nr:TrmJ/YjtD family RNA methyltransferase [Deltaproteobacteria bacterium]
MSSPDERRTEASSPPSPETALSGRGPQNRAAEKVLGEGDSPESRQDSCGFDGRSEGIVSAISELMSSAEKPRHWEHRPKTRSRSHIDVILHEPQKPENIGAAARAMANMGLGRLIAVRPRTINKELMEATATIHAKDVLDNLVITQDLREALAPYRLVVGTTARPGSRRGSLQSPRQLAAELMSVDNQEPVVLVFGAERMGLSTADLRLCQKVVSIPTASKGTSSLNLAQAVLIVGYELLLAAGGEPKSRLNILPAQQSSLNLMYDELEDVLTGIGFLPADNSGHWLMNIKKIFNRSFLTKGECDLLMGVCRQIRWAVNNMDCLERGQKGPKREQGRKP